MISIGQSDIMVDKNTPEQESRKTRHESAINLPKIAKQTVAN